MSKKMDSDKFYCIDHSLLEELVLHDGKICPTPGNGHINGRSVDGRQAVEGKLYIPRSTGSEKLPSKWREGIEIRGLTAHLPDGTIAAIYEHGTPRPSGEAARQQMALEIHGLYEVKRAELIGSVINSMGALKGPKAEAVLDNILHNLTTEISQSTSRPQFAGFVKALLALELINERQQGEMLHALNELCDLGIRVRRSITPNQH